MTRPRIGFLGVGWIGRSRMEAIVATGAVDTVAIVEPSPEMREEALALAPEARVCADDDELLGLGLDGIVIATPSAMHARQSSAALNAGSAVFCQKPLGRDAAETQAVVDAARAADRLLAVDFSYRFTEVVGAVRPLVSDGALGAVQLVDLTFHNAYGPDKPWFYDKAQAGGGCVVDLGVHLVDLALWTLGWPEVVRVESSLYAGGAPLAADTVEDLAVATLHLAGGTTVRLACSWRLHAGCDAVIAADWYGTAAAAGFRNQGGSFLDFTAHRSDGTRRATLTAPPDAWSGRAAADWAIRLANGARFDPEAQRITTVAEVLDRIYAAAASD